MIRKEAIQWLKHINITDFGWDDYAMQDSQKEIRERCEQSIREAINMAIEALSADAEKKKAELKENGDWDCPNVDCDECDHHRSVEWCSLAIPNHEKEIDETYKMANEAFFEGFDAAEKRYRFLIEYVEELDKKLADAEWIPCSERLPSEDGCYLVSTTGINNDIIDIAFYTEDIWHKASRIKAWMPLPKSYREESEE